MKRLASALALACASLTAHADTWGLHLGSHHFPDHGMNNFNPGLMYRTDAGWTGGAYLNSIERVTVYGGRAWGDRAALFLGLGTGYGAKLTVMAVPSLRLTDKRAVLGGALRLNVVPKYRQHNGAVHLMWERQR